MAILFAVADIIHESIPNTGNGASKFIGRPGPASQIQNDTSPGSQMVGNRNAVGKEQSRPTGYSMKETTSQRILEGELESDQEKIGLDRP